MNKVGEGPKSFSWDEVVVDSGDVESDEALLRNTFLNMKIVAEKPAAPQQQPAPAAVIGSPNKGVHGEKGDQGSYFLLLFPTHF